VEESFVDLCRPRDQMEVALIRMALEGSGIRYYIVNENLNRVLPVPSSDMVLRVERGRAADAASRLADVGVEFSLPPQKS
jgi:hypothetical protein